LPSDAPQVTDVTIGILRDRAFQFYYEENLEALRQAGATLVTIDALNAPSLPDELDGLYIGGGFPETSVVELAANGTFRQSIRERAEAGLPIYAECGGLIYLGRSLVIENREYPLVDIFPVTFGIGEKPQAHGYSIFTVERENPFYAVGTRVKGHEFRYSTVREWDGTGDDMALVMERGTGFSGKRDGLVKNNVLALYTHVLAPGTPEWASGLVAAARHFRQES
jgi:cobyrinic acid a,c-diamide synthase